MLSKRKEEAEKKVDEEEEAVGLERVDPSGFDGKFWNQFKHSDRLSRAMVCCLTRDM